MAHKGAYAVAASRLKSDKAKYKKSAESGAVKKAMYVAVARARVKKAKAAQKAAQAKLSPRQSLLQKVGKSLSKFRASISGDSARTKSISKVSGVKSDSQRRASKRKGY